MAGALDLLTLLGGMSANKETLSALSGKTASTEDQVAQTLLQALPSMLGKMQSNASTKSGADSLLKALDQHDLSEEDIVKLIKSADAEDGIKILNHIYGDEKKTAAVQKEVAQKTGLDTAKVAKIMAIAAPILLTTLAKTNKKANKTQSVSNSDGLADLLGGVMKLAGGSSKKSSGLDISDVATLLGALMK